MSGIAITFPSSPVEGQSYLAQNGFTYIYDSQKNRWKRGGEFVRAPKVLSYAGVAATTTGAGIATGPTGSLIYVIPGTVNPNSEVGVDSYKAYRAAESYPNYTEVQVSISSAFSTIAYAATFTGTTHTIPPTTLSGDTTYYLRARQFVGSNASAASTGAISGYSANPVKFTSASVYLDTPTIVSIAGTTSFPVYQIGFAGTTLPATVTYGGGGLSNLDKVEWRITGPRIPSSTGDTALAEVGIGTHSSTTLANALVLAMPFSGASGVGITSDVNNAIRTASSASAGTTKTVTANGGIGTSSIAGLALTSHFYPSAANFNGSTDDLRSAANSDFDIFGGDCTVEGWYYFNSVANAPHLWQLGLNSSTRLGVYLNSGVLTVFQGSNVLTAGSILVKNWYHIALTKKSTMFSVYVNGILSGSVSTTGPIGNNDLCIGQQQYGSLSSDRLNGYVQDFKIYKGLAKYQENFTPPLPTYGTISYTTGITNVGVATTAFFESTGDTPTAEVAIGSSTAAQVASSLVLAMPMNRTFGFQDINVAVRGLTSGASAGTAKGSVTTNTYRYWRLTQVLNFQNHTARASRYYLIQSNGTKTNIVTYTTDNCSDSGTILSNGSTITYDFTTPTSVRGFGLYAVFNSAGYGSTFKLEGSTDNTNWVFVSYGDILKETTGCSEIDAILYTSRIPHISSSESKYYDGSACFTGIQTNYNNTLLPNYVLIPQSSDFAFGTGNYTIEWWKYWNTISGYQTLYNMNYNLSNNLLIQTGNGDGKYRVFSNNASPLLSETNPATSGRWYHYALVRNGTNLTIYRDGIANGSITDSSDVGRSDTSLEIGRGEGKYPEQGQIQDLRVYKGFAKYTANFTPPQPICGFTTDISTQTGFTTTTATGALLSSVVGLGSTSTLAFGADQNLAGVTSITSSSGITTLPDPYAQNLVLALPLANITGVGNSFTNDRNTQIRSVSITGAGVTAGTTKTVQLYTGSISTSTSVLKYYNNTISFNGSSGIYATVPAPGTNNFTQECWFYQNNLSTTRGILNTRTGNTTDGTDIAINSDGSIGITYTGTGLFTSAAGLVVAGNWYHFAYVRDGNTFRVYLNGNYIGGFINSTNFTSTIFDIGFNRSNSNYTNGYMQDVRVYNFAKYTTNFTPPPPMFGDYTRSTPNKLIFTPSSDYVLEARNTSGITTSSYSTTRQWGTKPKGGIYDPYASNLVLAIPFDAAGAPGTGTTTFDVTGQIKFETPTTTYVNAGIVTYSNSLGIGTYQNKTITTVGTASSTNIFKYYNRSRYFNGDDNNYVSIGATTDFAPSSGSGFTVEFWVYPLDADFRIIQTYNSNNSGWLIGYQDFGNDVNGISYSTGNVRAIGLIASAFPINQWYHITACWNKDNTCSVFVNGILRRIIPSDFSTSANEILYISRQPDSSNNGVKMHLQDLRIYKGIAKYTSNFTPPNQIYLT